MPDPSTWTFNPRPGITDKSDKIIKVDTGSQSSVSNTSGGDGSSGLEHQGLIVYLRNLGVDWKFLTTVGLLISTIIAVVCYFPRVSGVLPPPGEWCVTSLG